MRDKNDRLNLVSEMSPYGERRKASLHHALLSSLGEGGREREREREREKERESKRGIGEDGKG